MITGNLKKAAMLALVVMFALAAGGCGKSDEAGQDRRCRESSLRRSVVMYGSG